MHERRETRSLGAQVTGAALAAGPEWLLHPRIGSKTAPNHAAVKLSCGIAPREVSQTARYDGRVPTCCSRRPVAIPVRIMATSIRMRCLLVRGMTRTTAPTIAINLRQRSAQHLFGAFRSAPATDILPMAKLTPTGRFVLWIPRQSSKGHVQTPDRTMSVVGESPLGER